MDYGGVKESKDRRVGESEDVMVRMGRRMMYTFTRINQSINQ